MNTVLKITIIGLMTALISSCTSGTTASAGALDISGTWLGSFLSDILTLDDPDVNPSEVERISAVVTLTLSQDAAGVLTGIANISDPETSCFTGGPISAGTITGSTYTITIADGFGSTITLTGQATATTMDGVYNATAVAERCPPHTGEASFTM